MPGRFAVAARAVLAQLALVLVIGGMAGNATCIEPVPIEKTRVAGVALDLQVLVTQRIARVTAVIEGGALKGLLRVAGLALFPVAPFVAFGAIVALMTGVAVRRQLGPEPAFAILLAPGAFLLSLGALGRERGEFWLPVGLFIGPDDRIYIADSYNQRVQVLRYIGGPT